LSVIELLRKNICRKNSLLPVCFAGIGRENNDKYMLKNDYIIAERDIVAIEKKFGYKKDITIKIFSPQPTKDGKDCFCRICFDGIEGESYNVGGADSLQALSLAISKTKLRFDALQNGKYDFFWPADGSLMESVDYDFMVKKFQHQQKK
jgi:hypothetical protein